MAIILYFGGAQIFDKCRRNIKILAATVVT
jgi:hypothetical protein